MSIDYASVWNNLPPDYRTRFLTRPTDPLVAEDIVVLHQAGALTVGAYWSESGADTATWWITRDFERFIAEQIRRRRDEIWRPHVDAAKVPLTDRGDVSGPLTQAEVAELAALDAALAALDAS